ncbi:MAG: HAD family phosphatase [Prevotella sp.]|nr:HAD family phosphatase [Prevotella sp.]
MEKNEIKNIVFDLGGVLVGLDGQRCIKAFEAIGCGDVANYVKEHRVEDLFLEQELGRITSAEFCDEVRRICQCDATDEQISWAWNELLTPISDEKLNMLAMLSGRDRVFLLSNTNDIHWQKSAKDFFHCNDDRCRKYFEKLFLSYEIHLAKPQREIFEYVRDVARIEPEETIFIDDSVKNCESAAAVGYNVIHEQSGTDWLRKLQELLAR